MAEPTTPTRVQFMDGLGEPKAKLRQQPTQKYDRKEIQKRLDIESWMEEQLKDIFDCEADSDEYPQLDIDDVLKIQESQREERLREYLKSAKKPTDTFIKELLEKATTVKAVHA